MYVSFSVNNLKCQTFLLNNFFLGLVNGWQFGTNDEINYVSWQKQWEGQFPSLTNEGTSTELNQEL